MRMRSPGSPSNISSPLPPIMSAARPASALPAGRPPPLRTRERPADQPVVPERILDAPLPDAVRLVGDGNDLGPARGDRLFGHGVGIFDEQFDANRRAAERLGAEVLVVRRLVRHVEPRTRD